MADNLSDVYLNIAGVTGESSDVKHAGKDGWIVISSFNFGFSFDTGTSATSATPAPAVAPAGGKAATAPAAPAKKDDTNQPNKPVTFTKQPDAASTQLAQYCYDGTLVETVTFEVCRYGGTEAGEGARGAKIAFLDLIFKNVTFKKSAMQISGEGLPSESLEFTYETVTMTTIWTDNATGDRIPGGQNRAGWNFKDNVAATS